MGDWTPGAAADISLPQALAMGDSDDEYDRRRRDKFRRERSDYDRSRERDDRRRDDWNDRWGPGRDARLGGVTGPGCAQLWGRAQPGVTAPGM